MWCLVREEQTQYIPKVFTAVLGKAIYIAPKSIEEDTVFYVPVSFVRKTLLCLESQA